MICSEQVRWATIDKFPKSRLQKLRYATSQGILNPKYLPSKKSEADSVSAEILALCDFYSLATREFFFDRSPRIFENILGLYRCDRIRIIIETQWPDQNWLRLLSMTQMCLLKTWTKLISGTQDFDLRRSWKYRRSGGSMNILFIKLLSPRSRSCQAENNG